MEYYLLRNGEQFGPCTADDLRSAFQRGEVQADDLGWCAGADDWKPIAQLLDLPAAEPATARQKAFLAFMGVTLPEGATRQQAAVVVNDAMGSDPSRLARWNAERLKLHPELFAEEIQARKEGRAQHFLEHCQREGAAWFAKVAKAHCQVVIAHLDVDSPGWDAGEPSAAAASFFPALAKKFPQLLTAEGQSHFDQAAPEKAVDASKNQSSPIVKRSRPSSVSRKIFALVRGAIYGLLILTGLWFARPYLEKAVPRLTTPAARGSAGPAPVVPAVDPKPDVIVRPAVAGDEPRPQ